MGKRVLQQRLNNRTSGLISILKAKPYCLREHPSGLVISVLKTQPTTLRRIWIHQHLDSYSSERAEWRQRAEDGNGIEPEDYSVSV